MKRFHIHMGVKDITESVKFYSALFGKAPMKQKDDYAKWLLEDPHLNFAISTRTGTLGVDHLGIQVEESAELEELTGRLKKAELKLSDEGEATCCYSKSEKAWTVDPSGVAWETYRNMADAEVFSEKPVNKEEAACCAPSVASKGSCC